MHDQNGTDSSSTPTRLTTTFVGTETVTVDAGTYDTCRFDQTMEQDFTFDGQTTTFTSAIRYWITVGTGVRVQYEVDGEVTQRLQSVSINGVDI